MFMPLTPTVASNMASRSRFPPPLASSCLVLPPCSSTVPSRLTCLHLLSFSVLPSYCDFVFMFHALSAAIYQTWWGKKKDNFPFPIFLPIKEQKVSNESLLETFCVFLINTFLHCSCLSLSLFLR